MSLPLIGFLKSTLGKINKPDAEMDLQNSITIIRNNVDAYTRASPLMQNAQFQSKEIKELVKTFYKALDKTSLDVRLTISNNFIEDSITLFKNLEVNGGELQNKLRDFKSNVISTHALSAKQTNLLMSVPHFYFISRVSSDLINYIIARETEIINRAPTEIPKIVGDQLAEDIRIYATLLGTYAKKPATFASHLASLSDVILSADQNARVEAIRDEQQTVLVNGLPNGFLGSPIYSIRSVIAKWQADRYINMQDEKRLIELRLNNLESLKASGETDAEDEQEIKDIQHRVNKMNYKLKKMEESVE